MEINATTGMPSVCYYVGRRTMGPEVRYSAPPAAPPKPKPAKPPQPPRPTAPPGTRSTRGKEIGLIILPVAALVLLFFTARLVSSHYELREPPYVVQLPHETPFYRGELARVSDLPMTGNQLWDTWKIGEHMWVWSPLGNTTAMGWVDP